MKLKIFQNWQPWSRDSRIISESQADQKFHLIGYNFWFSHPITVKSTFSENSHHYLFNDVYNLFGLAEVQILTLLIVMKSL